MAKYKISLQIGFAPTVFHRFDSQLLLSIDRPQKMYSWERYESNEEVTSETEAYFTPNNNSIY